MSDRNEALAGVLSWDWRGQPDVDELDRIIANLTGCRLRAYEVDTGSDECAVVIATADLTPDAAKEVYVRWLDTTGNEFIHINP